MEKELKTIDEFYDINTPPFIPSPPTLRTVFLSPSTIKGILEKEKEEWNDMYAWHLKEYEGIKSASLERLKEYTDKVTQHKLDFKEDVLKACGLENHPKANELFEFAEMYYVPAFAQFSGSDTKYDYHSGVFNFLRRLAMLLQ